MTVGADANSSRTLTEFHTETLTNNVETKICVHKYNFKRPWANNATREFSNRIVVFNWNFLWFYINGHCCNFISMLRNNYSQNTWIR